MPNVSIITLFHNRWDLARLYIDQWRAARPDPEEVELIFGDCSSSDGTAQVVGSASGLADVTLFGENLGFSRGNNALAAHARGRFLVFLNNDVQLEKGWLEELIGVFADRPGLGIAGNVQFSVYAREVDHAGIFFTPEGRPVHFRPAAASLPREAFFPAPAVTGACMAVRRELFRRLGGFDEGFRNSYEDVDLCLRAHKAGAEVGVASRSSIWHYVGSSPGRFDSEEANAARFASLWAEDARKWSAVPPPVVEAQAGSSWVHPIMGGRETLQVFFPSASGYREEDSALRLYSRNQWTDVEVPLPEGFEPGDIPLRFDPGRNAGSFALASVALRRVGEDRPFWRAEGNALAGVCRASGTCRIVTGGPELNFQSDGDDPQVLVALPAKEPGKGGRVWFGVRLRTDCAETAG